MAEDGKRRKVDPEEAVKAMAERSIDNTANIALREAGQKDYYPVGRDVSTKEKKAERDIDSITNLSRQEAYKKFSTDFTKRNR